MARGNAKSPEARKTYKGKNISIFFQRVRERRLELELKQSNIAEPLGLATSRISELEGGRFFDDPDRIIALARALETTPDYLFGFRDEP